MKTALSILLLVSATSLEADLLSPEPIVGHCTGVKADFDTLISQYNYRLVQTSDARGGRKVEYYLSGADNMIAVVDIARERWCVQFTSEDPNEFVRYLVGRYDPTTRGDEGTK